MWLEGGRAAHQRPSLAAGFASASSSNASHTPFATKGATPAPRACAMFHDMPKPLARTPVGNRPSCSTRRGGRVSIRMGGRRAEDAQAGLMCGSTHRLGSQLYCTCGGVP